MESFEDSLKALMHESFLPDSNPNSFTPIKENVSEGITSFINSCL